MDIANYSTIDLFSQLKSKKMILLGHLFTEEFLFNMMQDFLPERIYIVADRLDILTIMEKEQNYVNNSEWFFVLWFPEKVELSRHFLKHLIKHNVKNYKFISPSEHKLLYNRFFIDYLEKRQIDTHSDTILIGDFVFDNFFRLNYGEVNLGDSVLPSFFNDYSMANEGPFEYGQVSLSPNDVVFDCGANIGFFSAIAISKGCQVHAFEPTPATYEKLRHTLCRYHCNQYQTCNKGLYHKECIAEFFLYDYSEGNSMVLDRGTLKKAYYPVTTIDQYVTTNHIPRVDFIKADIEGAERYMLMGARETISRFRPKLSICTYHFADDPRVIEEIIKSINDRYIVKHMWKKIYAYVPK